MHQIQLVQQVVQKPVDHRGRPGWGWILACSAGVGYNRELPEFLALLLDAPEDSSLSHWGESCESTCYKRLRRKQSVDVELIFGFN